MTASAFDGCTRGNDKPPASPVCPNVPRATTPSAASSTPPPSRRRRFKRRASNVCSVGESENPIILLRRSTIWQLAVKGGRRECPENASLFRLAPEAAPNSEDQAMADELTDADIAMDGTGLYREET